MIRNLKIAAVFAASAGVTVCPQSMIAAQPPAQHDSESSTKVQTIDIKLDGDTLKGRVVAANGQASETEVAIFRNKSEVARTTTNDVGEYQFDDLSTGSYVVATPTAHRQVRAWSAGAPNTAQTMLTIQEGSTVRGNYYNGGYGGFGMSQAGGSGGTLLAAGITAAVIGTTVAVVEANDDDNVRLPITP